jgi:hypothetical protein
LEEDGRDGENMERQWKRRGRKSTWEGEQWIVAQEKEGEWSENRDEKILMVKLIVQRENRNKNKIKFKNPL